ncbi:MAG: DNA methyltransferase [Acidimicrobiales bacterium]
MTVSADPWQLLPPLSDEEFASLKADVAARGIVVPVVVDAETGAVIDGHHRLKAHEELRAEGQKIADYPRDVRRFGSDEERVAVALSLNLARRHLSRAQRRELVASLREQGWSLRRIGEVVGVDDKTVRNDLAGTAEKSAVPERIVGKDGRSQPARRPSPAPGLFVRGRRDEQRARAALAALPEGAQPTTLLRAEERAREAAYKARRQAAETVGRITGPSFELRVGDLREVWDDIADGSIDAVVTDPPYDGPGIPLFEDLGRLAARVLKPGRLAAVYCGHVHLDEELRLLEQGGLSYVWHGVNILPGRHTKVRARMINGRHRSVLIMSAGAFTPRGWLHDTFFAEGRGGPETRPLHPWQQAVAPVVHWIEQVSEPGELIFDPFLGSGTTGVAALRAGRRFLGGDIEPGNVETTRRRLESDEIKAGEETGP